MPVAEALDLPAAYGHAERTLPWEPVRGRLSDASCYWVATVRPDGRPHLVPKDGVWVDDRLWFGGAPETVNHRNLLGNGNVAVHVGDGSACAIVEGTAALTPADDALAARLTAASQDKYGHAPPPGAYGAGVWALTPARVLAWTAYPADATRFRFTSGS